jgi:hypothetical protein
MADHLKSHGHMMAIQCAENSRTQQQLLRAQQSVEIREREEGPTREAAASLRDFQPSSHSSFHHMNDNDQPSLDFWDDTDFDVGTGQAVNEEDRLKADVDRMLQSWDIHSIAQIVGIDPDPVDEELQACQENEQMLTDMMTNAGELRFETCALMR